MLTRDEVFPEEDPACPDEGAEPEEEPEEEPDPGPPHPEAPGGEGLAPQLSVGDGVHPEVG